MLLPIIELENMEEVRRMEAVKCDRAGMGYKQRTSGVYLPDVMQNGVRYREVEITVNKMLRAMSETEVSIKEAVYCLEVCKEVLLEETKVEDISIITDICCKNLSWYRADEKEIYPKEFPNEWFKELDPELLREINEKIGQNKPLYEILDVLKENDQQVSIHMVEQYYLLKRKILTKQFL